MTFPKARVVVAACLFLGWLGFLLYLVIDSRTIVLSKPQFMVAPVYAVVQLQGGRGGHFGPDGTIIEVLWSADPADQKLIGQPIHVPGMSSFREATFLIPLDKAADGKPELAPIPRVDLRQAGTHGTVEVFGLFSHRVMRRLPIASAEMVKKELIAEGYEVNLTPEELRIYPWTPDVRAQVERFIATLQR